MLFAVVGYGLLLSAYKYGTWLGTSSVILIAAVMIQFGPLLQKLWFSILITGFGSSPNSGEVGSNISSFWLHYQPTNIEVSYRTHQTSVLAMISLFTALTAFIGRVNINQIMKLASFFTIFWNCNYFLLIRINTIVNDFNDTVNP